MSEAVFYHGDPLMVDHTPGADVAGAKVVVVGVVPFVSHRPIKAGELGALAAGGGVYKGTSDGTLDTGGAPVYWDNTAKKFSASAASSTHFGYTVPDQGATNDGDEVIVIHSPNRAPTASG